MPKRLADEEKIFILKYYEKRSLRRLGELLNRSHETIRKFYLRATVENRLIHLKPGGRKETLTPKDKKLIESFIRRRPKSSLQSIKEAMGLTCCLKTLSKALRQRGFRKYKMQIKPKLLERHEAERLQFAKKYVTVRNWDKVSN
jgi:transposase